MANPPALEQSHGERPRSVCPPHDLQSSYFRFLQQVSFVSGFFIADELAHDVEAGGTEMKTALPTIENTVEQLVEHNHGVAASLLDHALLQSRPDSTHLTTDVEGFVFTTMQNGIAVVVKLVQECLAKANIHTEDLFGFFRERYSQSERLQSLSTCPCDAVQILLEVEQNRRTAAFAMLARHVSIERPLMLQLMSIRDPRIQEKIEPVEVGTGRFSLPSYP
ncbi:MAG: hypothetical protein V1926_01240 [Candidatus Peregrinibacteria bacterium]